LAENLSPNLLAELCGAALNKKTRRSGCCGVFFAVIG